MFCAVKKIFPLMLSIILLLSTGCGSDTRSDNSQQVTIAVQGLPNDESIARAWYEDELGKELGIKVVVLDYSSSALLNNAMATGNIDIAVFGSPNAAIGISKKLPYKIFWVHNVEGENESLVVKDSSDINSVADLKGKRVGVPFGATTHYALLLALQDAGLDADDIRLFDMQPPEILSAWNQNTIDAAFVWQPTLGVLLNDGRILLSSRQLNERNITTADVGVVNQVFAKRHPNIVKKYIELQIKAHELFKNEPRHASELAADTLGIPSNVALKQMKELVWLDTEDQISDRYLGTSEHKGHFAETLAETAKFLEKYNVLQRAANLETFENAIDTSFIEAVAK